MHRVIQLTGLALVCAATVVPIAQAETEAPATSEPLTVRDEPSGDLCGEVTNTNDSYSGNCGVHLASNANFEEVGHTIFGESALYRCRLELTGAMNQDGEGYFGRAQIQFVNPAIGGLGCTGDNAVRACHTAEAINIGANENWHFQIVEDHTTNDEWMEIRHCIAQIPPAYFIRAGLLRAKISVDGTGHPTALVFSDHRSSDTSGGMGGMDSEMSGSFLWEILMFSNHNVELIH
jgi:hypothetical protein